MLGIPEALQQRGPGALAAVPVPRAEDPADEGVRGGQSGSLGSPGETVLTRGPSTLPSSSQRKGASAGSAAGSSVCLCMWATRV